MIIPPDFNSTKPVSRYFGYDLNMKGCKTKVQLLVTPHRVFLACKLEDDQWCAILKTKGTAVKFKREFVSKEGWLDKVKVSATSWVWGGESEQKWLEMRQSSTESLAT